MLFVFVANAQKTKFKDEKFELTFTETPFFKDFKTFSYTIQDDGLYWNHAYEENEEKPEDYDKYPTLVSLSEGLKINGLTNVENNADLQIVVGFLGKQLANNAGAIVLEGTLDVMLLTKEGKVLFEQVDDFKRSILTNFEKYPIKTRFLRNKTKATIVTEEVQKVIADLNVLFTGKSFMNLSFGHFTKTKKGQAEIFNNESEVLIKNLTQNTTKENLIEAKDYWKKQIDVDFGKKLK